ncbi:bifunctional glutamate N-acetyltransferase/amino-acid acetyltransferase ArgJ [Curvivirga aplysinae]|uniref:bifunctional glutamate N-acetyltransferase/amino-acid acetyltransferase ArgJ n=1 Tax=Curvivirga aplysinae TaxID=2529852 RepID=UPI0012BBDFD7|nr:bifunctional glutamate N-acetyltransferase/amino-acid acetyltransferase ArgJ [Curvivirga aplysinae]MTI10923.1 bifunctional glutamate N-acetyltransferase/amino-acid acetyltransferase ArgJ [Curvivirga aplysinae]
MSDISPLAPEHFPKIPVIKGVKLGAAEAGVKYEGRTDLFLAELAEGSTVAGVLTQSLTRSAPVDWCRKVLPNGEARAIVVNSGNANAFTGKSGVVTTEAMVSATARTIGCEPEEVLVASTGVIGERLPVEKIEAALPGLKKSLKAGNWETAAEAIMTTDTFPKASYRSAKIGGVEVQIGGIAKGSGMIAPDMATMLSFVFTDANIPASVLRLILKRAADKSFNCMTVDGDTSTSDTLIMAATAKADHPIPSTADDLILEEFTKAVDEVMIDLAQQIAKDGEGASKFITIDVTGADSDRAAKTVALSIANSPLVKTAIAGEDANWGRVVMAVGKAGERADRDTLTVSMGGVVIAEKGEGVDGYDEAPVANHLQGDHVNIAVDLGIGDGQARVWTCDLTHGYISINADYRS